MEQVAIIAGVHVSTDRPGLAIRELSADILAGQLSDSSISMYRRDFAAYVAFAGSQAQGPALLAQWRAYLAQDTSYSPNTINRMLSAVKRIVKEAAIQGYITHEVAESFGTIQGVKVKALKKRLKDHARTKITAENMRRLCDAPNGEGLTARRDRALLATLASSGARITEIVTLTRQQIIKKGSGYMIVIMGKNDEEPREAPLSTEAYHLIGEWLQARGIGNDLVFTSFESRNQQPLAKALAPVSAWKAVRKYAQRAGLDYIKPHDFRRFVGTELAKKDIRKAQKALGHKRIDTTARHYVLDELESGLTDELY